MIKIFLMFFFVMNFGLCNQNIGRIVKMTGDVKILTNPSTKKVAGPGPHVLFQKKYYTIKEPRLGFKIGNGNIVQTGNNSKVRIVFKNGDQYNVAAGTAYEVNWTSSKKGAKKGKSLINLMRGQIRAVVSKKGPRNNLKVKTRYASMGVRGTDFYVSTKGQSGPTKVSVLRGEVEMKAEPKVEPKKVGKVVKKIEAPKAIKIKSGFTAKLEAPVEPVVTKKVAAGKVVTKAPVVEPAIINVAKTNKAELVEIQKDSVIKVKKEERQVVTKELAKEIKELDKKAVETTLNDIKDYDPELYKEIKKKPVTSVAAVNASVVKKVFKKAPVAPEKPDAKDLGNIEEDAYDRYFKID